MVIGWRDGSIFSTIRQLAGPVRSLLTRLRSAALYFSAARLSAGLYGFCFSELLVSVLWKFECID